MLIYPDLAMLAENNLSAAERTVPSATFTSASLA
jgi:hypothetical protein